MKNAADYADIIIRDEREKIVSETPTKYGADEIERIYEFADGAVVRYEWRNLPSAEKPHAEGFNHRFTLVETPRHNPHQLKKGVIRQVNYLTDITQK